jgi:hypothetical protein
MKIYLLLCLFSHLQKLRFPWKPEPSNNNGMETNRDIQVVIKGETLYANDEYVCRRAIVTLERLNIFEICFRCLTEGV